MKSSEVPQRPSWLRDRRGEVKRTTFLWIINFTCTVSSSWHQHRPALGAKKTLQTKCLLQRCPLLHAKLQRPRLAGAETPLTTKLSGCRQEPEKKNDNIHNLNQNDGIAANVKKKTICLFARNSVPVSLRTETSCPIVMNRHAAW